MRLAAGLLFTVLLLPAGAAAETTAVHISYPTGNSLVRADVPIFGVAACPNFKQWRLEVAKKSGPRGEAAEPEWRLLASGDKPVLTDPWATGQVRWNPSSGAPGNLFTWPTGAPGYDYTTYTHIEDRGVYRLRLSVQDTAGKVVSDEVTVQVADVFSNVYGGYTISPDGGAEMRLAPRAMQWRYFLIGITPFDQPAPGSPGLTLVGTVYEVQPPGVELQAPARLKLALDGDPVGTGIYWYDWWNERWMHCESKLEGKALATDVVLFPRWRALYAIYRDGTPPAPPALGPVPATTSRRAIRVTGSAEPFAKIEARRGNDLLALSKADATGAFSFPQLALAVGPNRLAFYSTDPAGNRCAQAADLAVRRIECPPRKVLALEILTPEERTPGQVFRVRLTGDDASPETIDTTYVEVRQPADQALPSLELVETGAHTGVYEGGFQVVDGPDAETAPDVTRIRIDRDGEKVVLESTADPAVRAEWVYRDVFGPPPPRVALDPTYARVCWTFEEPASEVRAAWHGVGGSIGAAVSVESGEGGNRFLRLTQQQDRSTLGVAVPISGQVDLDSFPLLSFDYRIPQDVGIDLYLTAPGSSWRRLKLCSPVDCFQPFGRVEGIVADGRWHHADVNLRRLFKPEDFAGSPAAISALEFACYVGQFSAEMAPGRSIGKGAFYELDNVQMYDCPPDGAADARWECSDPAGIVGFAAVVDQNPLTVPEPRVTTPDPSLPVALSRAGRWFLHVQAVDGLGNWGDPVHYPFTPAENSAFSLAERAEQRVALLRDPAGISPEMATDQMAFAKRLRVAKNYRGSAAIEEALSAKVEQTLRIEALRRCLLDLAAAPDFEKGRAVLFGYAGVDDQNGPTADQALRITTFIRQAGSAAAFEGLYRALAESLRETPELSTTVLVQGLARKYLDESRFTEAEAVCREAAGDQRGTPQEAVALEVLAASFATQARRDELAAVCRELQERHPRSAARGSAVVTLARLDRADAQPQLAADELRSYLSSGPPADSRRAVLPEFFRAVWDVRQDPQDVSRETAALLDGTEAEKKANLPGLRLAVVALEAVGKLGAAEAVCRAMSEHAAGTPEADWASQWVLKKMGVKP